MNHDIDGIVRVTGQKIIGPLGQYLTNVGSHVPVGYSHSLSGQFKQPAPTQANCAELFGCPP